MIAKGMGIVESVQKYPQTANVFRKHGMGCWGIIECLMHRKKKKLLKQL